MIQVRQQLRSIGDHDLTRLRGSQCPAVSHQVADADIDFMADCADDRNRTRGDGASDDLFIEWPQVFQASAPATHDRHIDTLQPGQQSNPCGDLVGSPITLHGNWDNHDVRRRPAPQDDLQHVLDGRSLGTGHQSNATWDAREWPLPLSCKEPFGCERLPQLAKGQFESPDPLRDKFLYHQLISPAGRVEIESPNSDDFQAILEFELQLASRVPPQHSPQLGFRILERQEDMPVGGLAEIGNLPPHGDEREGIFHMGLQQTRELGHAQNRNLLSQDAVSFLLGCRKNARRSTRSRTSLLRLESTRKQK